jgi:hypothetical protein
MVNLTLRDQAGAELQRFNADTSAQAAGAQAQCAYVPSGTMGGTLAIAVGLKENFVVQLQIADAQKKPTLQQVSVLLHDNNPSTLTSLTLEQNACTLSDVKFDGKDLSLNLRCDNVGRELHAQRKLEAKIQVKGCPSLNPPVMAPPAK